MKGQQFENSLQMELNRSRALKLIRVNISISLKNEENRKEFEKWYLEKYGRPYIWKFKKQ